VVDLIILFALGWLGFGMRRFGFPVVPVVVGAMLGPLAEQHLLRSLAIGEGRWSIFVTRPGAAIMLLCALAIGIVVALRRGTPTLPVVPDIPSNDSEPT
jgi:putative tricarboxylic transport membrane protein